MKHDLIYRPPQGLTSLHYDEEAGFYIKLMSRESVMQRECTICYVKLLNTESSITYVTEALHDVFLVRIESKSNYHKVAGKDIYLHCKMQDEGYFVGCTPIKIITSKGVNVITECDWKDSVIKTPEELQKYILLAKLGNS